MEKFKNKYRIASTRLRHWDYGSNALYFVTICCKNRQCFFGDIQDGNMAFSPIGVIAEQCWLEIPQHFPFVVLHNHIVMPNHVHGIIEIAKTDDGNADAGVVETQNFASLRASPPPSTSPIPPPPPIPPSKNKFGPQSKNLASIVRGFKIGVTKNARKLNPDFH